MRKFAATAVLTAIVAVPLAGPATAAEQNKAAATVNMEAIVKAAMWDPYKPDSSVTPGSGKSVKTVERALEDKDFLADKYVDGHFGTSTVKAYSKYQKSLGHSGLAASGLPGKGSLTSLGKGRYDVTRRIDVGGKKQVSGGTLNQRTISMFEAAEKKSGINLTITQGSYNSSNGSSAGTHDGGGAVDIASKGIDADKAVKALRQVGFAAWHRTEAQGDWIEHIHAIAISDTDMSPEAQAQIGDYFLGKNGLANHAPDNGPNVKKVTWEQYKRG